MNLLIFTPGFAAGDHDTTCIPALQDWIEEGVMRGHSITVVALHYPFVASEYTWRGARVFALAGANRRAWNKVPIFWKAFRLGASLHSKTPFDRIIACWMGDAALVSSWLSRMFRLPLTVLIMGQDALGNRYWPIFRNRRAQLVTPSAYAEGTLLQRVGRKSMLNPFGLPSRILSVTQHSLRSIHFLSVGSLSEVKQPMHVLDLVLPVLARNSEWQAAWVGAWVDGELLAACRARVSDAVLADRYRFLGELPRQEAWAVMADARVLVHMARHEAQGMIIREGLALGCTVVTNGVGDVPDHPCMKVLTEGGADNSALLERLAQAWAPLAGNHTWPMSKNWMKYEVLWETEGGKLV